jgi:tetratricopeptide (TPR) repeat protein
MRKPISTTFDTNSHLAANPKLRIIARNTVFRYKNQEYSIREVGQSLNVEVILTGRIQRWDDRLHVGVELVNAAERRQIWGLQLNYRIGDFLEIEEKIVQDLLGNLTSFITNLSDGISKANNESQKLYLNGMYLLENRSLKNVEKAIKYFRRSITGNPENVQSYIDLAECYRLLKSYEKLSREEALNQISPLLKKAAELDPELPELYVFKGIVSLFWEFNFSEAEINLKQALKFDPNSTNAHYRYAELLIYSGRFSEAKSHIEEYARLNSLSLNGIKNTARLLYFMERFEDSLMKSEGILKLAPSDFEALLLSGIALTELGEYDKAKDAFQKSLALQNHSETISMLGYTNALSGKFKAAQRNLRQMEILSKKRHISPINYAVIYSALGNTEEAFDSLDKAFGENDSDVIALGFDPRLKEIRKDRKFSKVLGRLGLPLN